jgi:thiosulfate reductase cytochrome b subunit
MTATPSSPKSTIGQPAIVRIFHLTNIIGLFGMMASGLQIYNANPVFGGRGGMTVPWFFAMGGWLAGGRNWHFAFMWIYALNLLAYGIYILVTRRWRKRFTGMGDIKAIVGSKNPQRRQYVWHRLIYTSIIPVLLLAIASGIAMYQPVQFYWLSSLFGDWQTLRTVHFMTVPLVIIFAIAHSTLALKIGDGKVADAFLKVK